MLLDLTYSITKPLELITGHQIDMISGFCTRSMAYRSWGRMC